MSIWQRNLATGRDRFSVAVQCFLRAGILLYVVLLAGDDVSHQVWNQWRAGAFAFGWGQLGWLSTIALLLGALTAMVTASAMSWATHRALWICFGANQIWMATQKVADAGGGAASRIADYRTSFWIHFVIGAGFIVASELMAWEKRRNRRAKP